MRSKRTGITAALVSATLLIQVVVVAGQVRTLGKDKPKNIKKIIHLHPPNPAEKGANGIAKISAKIKGKKPSQTFQVVGANLKPGTTYDLFVDGVKIASEIAAVDSDEPGDDGASVEFFFSTKVKVPSDDDEEEEGHRPLPDSLQPVTEIKKVELKESSGLVVLTGEFI